MIVLFNSFKPVVPSQPQYSGFNNGYLGYGDTGGSYATATLVTYNRTISFSTDTESTRTAFSTARAPQGSSGFSPTSIYHVKGYNAGLVTTVDRVSPITDTSSTPTISFTTERRGPCIPLPNYNRNRIFFFGGYSDTLAQYLADTTYITQNTETSATGTSIPAARHLGVNLYTRDNSYLLGGIDSTGATTTTIYKYIMNTDTALTPSTAPTDTSNGQGYGLSYNSFGYRANGTPANYNNNKKFTFSTETVAAGVSGPAAFLIFQGISTVSLSVGYCWAGYQGTLNRLYHKLTFATETWSNNSYNTGDTNSGWLNAPGGC